MIKNKNALISWSGGKDSCLALHLAHFAGYKISALVTMMDESNNYSRSNGVSKKILQQQANAMDLPLYCYATSWENYEKTIISALTHLALETDSQYCIFGDIDIKAHYEFEEKICHQAGLKALLPLWGESRHTIANRIVNYPIKAKISAILTNGKAILGQDYSDKIFNTLTDLKMDICGENGEFHTLVYDAPLFNTPLEITSNKKHDLETMSVVEFTI